MSDGISGKRRGAPGRMIRRTGALPFAEGRGLWSGERPAFECTCSASSRSDILNRFGPGLVALPVWGAGCGVGIGGWELKKSRCAGARRGVRLELP